MTSSMTLPAVTGLLLVFTALVFSSVEAVTECKRTKKGDEYNGVKTTTLSGLTCQNWVSQSPHNHNKWTKFPEGSEEAAKNYCRNPDGSGEGPWCYTTDPNKRWEYCDVQFCADCKKTKKGEEYSGGKSTTVNGRTCQAWASQSPQTHNKWTNFPEGSEETAGNYCRNPDGSGDGPWCYTTDPKVRWEYCDIKFCAECKKTKKGEEYSGIKSKTLSGLTCQSWASQSPHNHNKWTNFPEGSEEAAKNYCRNPDGSGDGPWCYTTDSKVRWEYCNLQFCGECKRTELGTEYTGTLSTTVKGDTCQAWTSQTPFTHYNYTNFPDGGQREASNYCRNPDGSASGPWCYTTNPKVRWDYCNVKFCNSQYCKNTKLGTDYYGVLDKTKTGITCQSWSGNTPHNPTVYTNFPDGSREAAKNYCRNPDGSASGPWCYTTDPKVRWDYCDVKSCDQCVVRPS